MRILIADDDRMSRELLSRVLEKQGHEVVAAHDGEAASSALALPDAPRLLILDWMMPNLDGLELTRKIREAERDTDAPRYILMLTSRSDREQAASAMRAGVDDFVSKPFHPEELQARVEVGGRILALQQRLSQVARTDPLTGLPNRRPAEEALERELARHARDKRAMQVGIIDADHFKRVNDTLGHQAGDDVLRELGRRVLVELRPYDLLCRIGGEEFLVINPGNMNALQPWERLREAIAESPIDTRAGAVQLTISIGVAIVLRGSSADDVLAAADRALYRAKQRGRNRVEREWLGAMHTAEATHPQAAPQPQAVEYSSCSRIICAPTATSRVLVASSDDNVRSISSALHGETWTAVGAQDEKGLWTSLQSSNSPTVIVLDLAVAEADQWSLVRRLRAHQSQTHLPIHIAVLAASSELERIEAAIEAGVDDFLAWPVSQVELHARSVVWCRALASGRLQAQLEDKLRAAQDQLDLLWSTAGTCEHGHCYVRATMTLREEGSKG